MTIEFVIDTEPNNQNWDDFLNSLPRAHYSQSCGWGQLKHSQGWQVLRLLALADGNIIGGGQFLIGRKRGIPIAYLSKAPIFHSDNVTAKTAFLQKAVHLMRKHHVLVWAIQPPDDGEGMKSILETLGFFPLPLENIVPPGSTVIDLTKPETEYLQSLSKDKRRNLLSGERKGLRIETGSDALLPDAYQLLNFTAQRRGFSVESLPYFQKAFTGLCGTAMQAQFFTAFAEDLPLAALFVIAFGDTVTTWRSGSNNEKNQLNPNEAVYWAAIRWAKEQGYRRFDFGGINTDTARAIYTGKPPARNEMDGLDAFKLDFKGEITFAPESSLFFSSPLLRFLYRLLQPLIPAFINSPLAQKMLAVISRS